ncbi:MAG: HPP family protein [Alteraurantiacibacter sp.]
MKARVQHAFADWGRGALGATLGIGLTALASAVLLGRVAPGLPLIVASMGASAVLVFVRPASPFSQPWPVIGGNVIAGLAGLLAGRVTGQMAGGPMLACALAVGLTIAGMSLLRALHPPGGGTALVYALGATGSDQWGWYYLTPLVVNVALLAASGWLYNNLTGHSWPHRMEVPVPPRMPYGLPPVSRDHVEAVLADWTEAIDVDEDDLLAFIQAVERQRARKP